MKNKYFIVLFLLLASIVLYSQGSYESLIAKQDYSKAYKKAAKAYKKDDNSVMVNYDLSIIYNIQAFKKFNVDTAYYFAKIAKTLYSVTDDKELQKLNKKGINSGTLKTQVIETCKMAFELSKIKNTIKAYNYYIYNFTSSQELTKKAIDLRNKIAFNNVCKENTIQGYQNFINQYPLAKEVYTAKQKRNEIAFNNAKKANTEKAFQNFIAKYPDADELKQAKDLRDNLSFENAKETNTARAFKSFINKYPQSKYKNEAVRYYEDALFNETTNKNDYSSYLNFISYYPNNRNVSQAFDLLVDYTVKNNEITIMHNLIHNYRSKLEKRCSSRVIFEVLSSDGYDNSIKYFYDEYFTENHSIHDYINDLYKYSLQVEDLAFHIGVNKYNVSEYEQFIKDCPIKELSFIALQRLITKSVLNKNYQTSIQLVKKYSNYFVDFKKYNDLLDILEDKTKTISINKVKGVNTKYDEYNPIPTYDDRYMYFCAKDRKDGLGGEDIFIAEKKNGKKEYNDPRVLTDLCSAEKNEAPLSISADGNSMMIWNSDNNGDIFFSYKTSVGWSEPVALPHPINTKYFEGDAIFTADGQSIIFTSTRPNGYNLYTENTDYYHGGNEYPTDIYICTKDADGKWTIINNIGPTINTAYSERTPFLHPDGKTLYFSSDGHGGLGQLDVFMTKKLSENSWSQWSEPINLGKEINTPSNDWGFKFSTDGNYAFYSAKKQKKPLSSLTFVLDVSGSMSGSKIETLKKAAIDAITVALSNNTEVSIFTFPSSDYRSKYVDYIGFTQDYLVLREYIEDLYAGGGTPMYEAILKANEYTKRYKSSKSREQNVILMTDGDANGDMSYDELIRKLISKNLFFRHQCIALEVYYGSIAYDDLQKISTRTQGDFYNVDSYTKLEAAFADATQKLYQFNLDGANKDIYTFSVPVELKPNVVATIEGKILDTDNKPVEAVIKWEDLETGKKVGESKSDPNNGSFFIVLPMGKIYGYYIDKDEYFPISNNLDLRQSNTAITIKKDIEIASMKKMIDDGLAVPVNNLFFPIDKDKLLPESLPELKRVASIIKANKLKVQVSGHTDSTGTKEHNMDLSIRRAEAVRKFLISLGVLDTYITIKGYGATVPVTSNETEEGRAKNRRVELKFVN